MSKLRKQLQPAKRQYERMRYPGDLADVLDQLAPPVRSHWMRNLAIAAGLLIAASAVFVMINRDAKQDNIAKIDPKSVTIDPKQDVAVTPKTVADPIEKSTGIQEVEVATHQTEAGTESAAEEKVEEYVALSPAQIASTTETSVSLVPSFQSMSFSLPSVSISGIDSYVEQEEAQKETVQ